MNMHSYTKPRDQYNAIGTNDFESAVDRYALQLSRRTGLPVTQVLATLQANAAVKEH